MENMIGNAGRVPASPAAKKMARINDVDLAKVALVSNRFLRCEDVKAYIRKRAEEPASVLNAVHAAVPAAHNRPLATPRAAKRAAELGVDLALVTPSNGIRITEADVLSAHESASTVLPRESRREKIRGMRRVIAERMSKSYFLYPTVTLTTDADMSELMRFRAAFNAAHEKDGIKLSVTDIIVAAVAKALREQELINASIDGDEIVYHEDVNVGVAVALEKGGLLVPVVRHADKLSLESLCKETKRLIKDARGGTYNPDDMIGATFTVTNLGSGHIDSFNPIINYPESAILGVGRSVEKPVVINGMIAIRPRAVLSITHDHRLIDGVPASEFLKTVVNYMENPDLLA